MQIKNHADQETHRSTSMQFESHASQGSCRSRAMQDIEKNQYLPHETIHCESKKILVFRLNRREYQSSA